AMASAKSESDSPWWDWCGRWAHIPSARDPEPRLEHRLLRHPGSSRSREACTTDRPEPEHCEPAPAPRDATHSAGVAPLGQSRQREALAQGGWRPGLTPWASSSQERDTTSAAPKVRSD